MKKEELIKMFSEQITYIVKDSNEEIKNDIDEEN